MASADPVIAVIGAGPAGLTAAAEMSRQRVGQVIVIDRESEPGGIPRHTHHTGFGLRDVHRNLRGPAYARRLAETARTAGAKLWTSAAVTGWSANGDLEITSPDGRLSLRADAIALCTGCRERPRAARLVPGSRPDGVMTTGTLQQLVYLKRRSVGRRAVIVGAEHVSYSAVATLHHAGASIAALTTELPNHQSYAIFGVGALLRYHAPTLANTKLTRIHGRFRVEGVELTDLITGAVRDVACDLVVFTGDWAPDSELAVLGGLEMDGATGGPLVDTKLRTTRPGTFAAGNLTHPAETADIAALSGRHLATSVASYLHADDAWPITHSRLVCGPPLRWIVPQLIAHDFTPPPRGRFVFRSGLVVRRPTITIRQSGDTLWQGRKRQLVPNRSASLPAAWLEYVALPNSVDVAIIAAEESARERTPAEPGHDQER